MTKLPTAQKITEGDRLPWSLQHLTISNVFWNAVHKNFPGLQKHPGYPALFWHLLFGTWSDEQSGRLLLCSSLITEIEDGNPQHTQAGKFLERFKADALPECKLVVTGWTHKKCRQLKKLHLGPFEVCLAEELRGRWDAAGRVYLDGSKFTEKRQRKKRKEQQQFANLLPAQCEIASRIRGYMNSLAPNLFTRAVMKNYSSAMKAAANLPAPATANMQQRMLRHIRAQPQPFYAPSPARNTVRLFSSSSIPNLQGEVRRALTRGWPEADLRCSQLAICAKLWNVPAVTKFLATGENIWTHLSDASGIPMEHRELAKPIIKKRAIYPICFGMEEHHVRGLTTLEFMRVGINREAARKLLQNPLIRALLAARNDVAETVNEMGGEETCFGKWCPVTDKRQARHVLAEVAQAWEMRLIYSAFALAAQTRAFAITLFQHDGFSVHFHERAELWKERLENCVNAAAREQGIITKLEWKG